jgi:hypothetical protein
VAAAFLIEGPTLLHPQASRAQAPSVLSCETCLEACEAPLNSDDDVLDQSNNSFMPRPLLVVSTGIAIAMARRFQRVIAQYSSGHVGASYQTYTSQLQALAARENAQILATTAEIRALKDLQTALYTDLADALQRPPVPSRNPRFAATLRDARPVLQAITSNVSPGYRITLGQRETVCRVLAAYRGQ